MRNILLSFCILFFATILNGQTESSQTDTVRVRLSVYPPVGISIIRIDGDKLLTEGIQRMVKLTTGEHRMELWAPNFTYKDTMITVVKGDRMIFKTQLELDPRFVKFKEKHHEIKVAEFKEKMKYRIPYFIAGSALVGSIATYVPTLKFNNKVNELRVRYDEERDPTQIVDIKTDLDNLKKKTIFGRSTSYVLLGVAVVSSVYGIIVKKKYKENYVPQKAPTYEDKSPFEVGFGGELNNQSIQLTYNF